MDKIAFSQMFYEADETSDEGNDVASLLKGARKRKAQRKSSCLASPRNRNAKSRSKSIQPASSINMGTPESLKSEKISPPGQVEVSSHKRRTKSFDLAHESQQLFKGYVFCEHIHT